MLQHPDQSPTVMSQHILVQTVGPPSPPPDVATVTVHALSAGHLTLPEHHFVHPASETARSTVPSLAFIIQHRNEQGKVTRIVLDLGVRRDISRYPPSLQRHAATRQPLSTDPDVTKSLAIGGLKPSDIDYVLYSHVHWDHVGEPRDFPDSTFVVGPGATDVLAGKASLKGGHSAFEADLLPEGRTISLPDPSHCAKESSKTGKAGHVSFDQPWTPWKKLPRVLDVFQDRSLYIVDAPGHLPGHVNLLARVGPLETDFVYLAGDACHDRRIMRREREIGHWHDAQGQVCCIHADEEVAKETIARIRELEDDGVEIIFAHDVEWETKPENRRRFFGHE